jgi:hypothetical protein
MLLLDNYWEKQVERQELLVLVLLLDHTYTLSIIQAHHLVLWMVVE